MVFFRYYLLSESVIKKILVPIDGSKYSRKALLHAIEIAKKFKSKLYLVTAVDTTDFPPGMLLSLLKKDTRLEKSIGEFVVAAKSIARKELLADVAVCKSKGALNAFYDVVAGNPVDSILKYERGIHPDLIIIGSKGLHGVGQVKALGSVSRKISEHAKCPVMIIH
jgi:nucleotide-binding universal stress UspA family protein